MEAGRNQSGQVFILKPVMHLKLEKVVCLLARIFSLRGKASLQCILCYFSKYKNAGRCLPWRRDPKTGALSWGPSVSMKESLCSVIHTR